MQSCGKSQFSSHVHASLLSRIHFLPHKSPVTRPHLPPITFLIRWNLYRIISPPHRSARQRRHVALIFRVLIATSLLRLSHSAAALPTSCEGRPAGLLVGCNMGSAS